jgi:hypothetical protein
VTLDMQRDERTPPQPPPDDHGIDDVVRDVLSALWSAGRGGARRARESIAGAIDAVLDRVSSSVVHDPLDVRDARAAHRRIDDVTANIGGTAAAVGAPWLVSRVLRYARRGRATPSTAVIAASATTLTSVAAGVQHLRVLASLLVHRLRDAGVRVDPTFVRRVAVGLYLDPSLGVDAVRAHRTAPVRLATDWGSSAVPFIGGRRTPARVHRAADAIARLDLGEAVARFERDRAIDLRPDRRGEARSD